MILQLPLKPFITVFFFVASIVLSNPFIATATVEQSNQPEIIEETGVIYATDTGIIFDADSGTVYDLQGNDLTEYAGERAIITGSLTTGTNGESILTIDTMEIEQAPAGNDEQQTAGDIGTEEQNIPDQGNEVEGTGLDNAPEESPQQI